MRREGVRWDDVAGGVLLLVVLLVSSLVSVLRSVCMCNIFESYYYADIVGICFPLIVYCFLVLNNIISIVIQVERRNLPNLLPQVNFLNFFYPHSMIPSEYVLLPLHISSQLFHISIFAFLQYVIPNQ